MKLSESETKDKKKLQLKEWYGSETDCASTQMRESQKIKFPLHIQLLAACNNSDLEEFTRLLELGTDINTKNSDGLTGVHLVCYFNFNYIFRLASTLILNF